MGIGQAQAPTAWLITLAPECGPPDSALGDEVSQEGHTLVLGGLLRAER